MFPELKISVEELNHISKAIIKFMEIKTKTLNPRDKQFAINSFNAYKKTLIKFSISPEIKIILEEYLPLLEKNFK